MLSDNIWWTRQSRIRTERRLLSNAFHSQILLLWYSFYSLAVSIYYIGSTQSVLSSKSWIIYSAMILAISSFINGFSYKERAALIKENYEYLKNLYQHSKYLEENKRSTYRVQMKYNIALNKCENHSPTDYITALYETYQSSADKTLVDPHPTKHQIRHFKINRFIRTLTLITLYLLPITISLISWLFAG